MKIHLCIVTGQPLANLIPILQERPDVIALAVTAPMAASCATFIATLKHCGWEATKIARFNDVPDHNYETILERALEIGESLDEAYPQGQITLNVTGGNKLMTLAFTNAFNDSSRYRVLYTDTTHNTLEILQPRLPFVPIRRVLDMETYLKAEGKTLRDSADTNIDWCQRAEARKPATKYLGNNCQELIGLIGQFNGQWGGDKHRNAALPLTLRSNPQGPWRKALVALADAAVIDWMDSTPTVTPMNVEAITYLTGGWLEEFVWWTAKDAGAEEVRCSVKFTDDFDGKADLRNEIDVAVLHNNRLLLIECKTGNMAQDGKDTEIVFKLDSLLDQAAGSLGAGLLVSAQPLVHKNSKGRVVNTRSRARSVNIKTAEFQELKSLRVMIASWLEGGRWHGDS